MTTARWLPLDAATVRDEIAGRSVARSYGDPQGEYASLREGALLVDRSARHRLELRGAKARELLTGLVTNDILALEPGQGCYAAALTPKGKMVADLRVYMPEPDLLLIDAPVRAADGWMQVVRKYVNPRLAAYTDVSGTTRQVGIYGARSREIVAAAARLDAAHLDELPMYSNLPTGTGIIVARVPDLRLDGFELYGPGEQLSAIWNQAVEFGATPGGLDAFEIARIEAGYPEWGLDMDDTTIPQEANLEEAHAISFTKGCYTGQEVVARVHFRGHVNRHLRALASVGGEPIPSGAELLDDTGKVVGDVRSTALSPRLGAIAIGMVRREVKPGDTLVIRGAASSGRVEVSHLPHPRTGEAPDIGRR